MYHSCSNPAGLKMTDPVEKFDEKAKGQSALKLALIEFAVVFVSEVGWNLVRKTGQSTIDAFGIALLTAVFLFAFHSK
jgi:hypothetical protein